MAAPLPEDPRRAERARKFAAGLAQAAARELALRGAHPGGPAVKVALARLEALLAGTPAEADLVAAQKALHQALTGIRRPVPVAAPRPGATRPLTGRLQAWLEPTVLPAASGAPGVGDGADRRAAAFVAFARQVLDRVGPRLSAVRVALATTDGNPGAGPVTLFALGNQAALAGGVPAPLHHWVPRLIRLNLAHPTAPRVERRVLGQWDVAVAATAEAGRPGFEPARAGATLTPLVLLPEAVREIPVLGELFPAAVVAAPDWGRFQREMGAAPKAEPAPPPRETPAEQASAQRLVAIAAYLQAPAGADLREVFRQVAEEHAYQAARAADLRERQTFAPDATREALEAEAAAVGRRVAKLDVLRKRLAAVR